MKVYAVVAFWLTASETCSGDSNGTVLAVLKRKPTEQQMKTLLKKWAKEEDLELKDDFGDPTYGVEWQESKLEE